MPEARSKPSPSADDARGLLRGRVVVVIGGTSGLGLSAARACARAGGEVVVVGRDERKLQRALETIGKDCARGLSADAQEPGTAAEAIDLALETFGRFDGLYHVAGGSGRREGDGPLDRITDTGWRRTLEWNLDALFYSNRAAVRSFLERSVPGSILNMGSVLGFSPSPHHFATHAYATAKAAIVGLTRASAAYYAPQAIRCNVIAPSLVETPMAARAAKDAEILEFIRTKQPLDGGRIGSPQDLDEAVVYFLSEASRFVTGQVLAVDGGWCVSEGQIGSER